MVHDGQADVAVDPDLGEGALAQEVLDGPAVSGRGEAQEFLVAVRQVVVLVVGDHPDRAAQVGVVAEVLAQQSHLLGRALFGDAAVGEVGDDVALGERLLAPQLLVGESDAVLLQEHRVVGLLRDRDRRQAALPQQGVEDPPVLVLVGAVPRDLRREGALARGYECRDAAVLPAALGFPAGGDRAEQPESLVVVEHLLEQVLCREHHCHLRAGVRRAPVKCAWPRRATGALPHWAERGCPPRPARRRRTVSAQPRNPTVPPALFPVTAVAGRPPSPHHGRGAARRRHGPGPPSAMPA